MSATYLHYLSLSTLNSNFIISLYEPLCWFQKYYEYYIELYL